LSNYSSFGERKVDISGGQETRIKNFEITYWPYAKGFIRVYGYGNVRGSRPAYRQLKNEPTNQLWYDWILMLGKIRIIKFGNPRHKVNLTDYNISAYDAIKILCSRLKK